MPFCGNILNTNNQSLESLNIGKNSCFDFFIKPIQLQLIPTTEVFIDDILYSVSKLKNKEYRLKLA